MLPQARVLNARVVRNVQQDQSYSYPTTPNRRAIGRHDRKRALRMEFLEGRRLLASGDVDPDFGLVLTDFDGTDDWSRDMAVQSDGKIVVVGSTQAGGSGPNLAIARYNGDGTLDASFGGTGGLAGGLVATDIDFAEDRALAVEIQSDGKILVAGSTDQSDSGDFVLARYLNSGLPDFDFGPPGQNWVTFGSFTGIHDEARAILVGDETITLVGVGIDVASNQVTILARFDLSDGALDTSFGLDGLLLVGPMTSHNAILQNGQVIIVGERFSAPWMMRINVEDLTVDSSFGDGGDVVLDTLEDGTFRDVILQPDGKIVGVGSYGDANSNAFVARFDENGNPDSSFSVDGIAAFETGLPEQFNSLAMQHGDLILAAGEQNDLGMVVRFGPRWRDRHQLRRRWNCSQRDGRILRSVCQRDPEDLPGGRVRPTRLKRLCPHPLDWLARASVHSEHGFSCRCRHRR